MTDNKFKNIKYCIFILIICQAATTRLRAQELSAQVTLNTQKVQSRNNDIFTALENDLRQLANNQKWTTANFSQNEKIGCSLTLIINDMPSDNSFFSELVVTSRRPVYNSTYLTPIFNYKDVKLDFNYTYGQIMGYNESNITDNLVAAVAFYSYILIGLDFDSFSLNGGKPYFEKALSIANSAQTFNTKGWEPFSSGTSRYDLAIALTEVSSQSFHNLWYNYHRLGLDEMAANTAQGKKMIIDCANELNKLYESRPKSPLLNIFAETKLDEMVKICSQATASDRKEVKNTLLRIYPTKKAVISSLD